MVALRDLGGRGEGALSIFVIRYLRPLMGEGFMGGVHPPINLEVFFTHILATASRLNTSYGLETLHTQSSRHVGITQKV